MKFRAVIENDGASQHQFKVLHVLQALQKLERVSDRRAADHRRGVGSQVASVVLKLTPKTFAFCHRGGADEGSQTWSHFHINRLFQEYRIESKRDGKIDLEAPIANLVHVFHSCASSDRTTLRLANGRDGRPILGFEFSLAGNVADHHVEQEVPVRVIPQQEADLITEPTLPEPEYQIELPPSLVRIKSVLDRMRQVGAKQVTIEAAQERGATVAQSKSGIGTSSSQGAAGAGRGQLRLEAEADLVSIASTFPFLALVMEGKKERTPEAPVKLILSLRRLGEVLAAIMLLDGEAHIACVLENRALVLYAVLPQSVGFLISYTPAVT
eukprot:TRINITY_DN70919_c0_g1_i1.p1 TRINITY_DN70919_c0_g1~~TRINITY_DN70919_c0_g1_i1.p1  ORF type:complete len:326 (-),score=42.55 TRINITY_DN70919_c0_g1_i1:61-1038(-)